MLKHCAANKKRRLSVLPNVSPYIYDSSRLRARELSVLKKGMNCVNLVEEVLILT
jgi:hypothetical protein